MTGDLGGGEAGQQRPEDLLDDEGHTAGDVVQPRRDRIRHVDAQQMAGELADFRDVERREPNAPGAPRGCPGERLTDRSGSEIRATGDDEGELLGLVSDEIREEVEGDGVRPVQILEHQDRGGHMLEQLRRRPEDLMPRLTLIGRSLRRSRETIGDLGHQWSQTPHDRAQILDPNEVAMMLEGVEHRPQRERVMKLLAMTDQHRRAVGHSGEKFTDQSALADPGFTLDDDQGGRSRNGSRQRGEFGVTTDQHGRHPACGWSGLLGQDCHPSGGARSKVSVGHGCRRHSPVRNLQRNV